VTGEEVVKAAVLTVSDRASAGAMEDESGPAVAKLLEGAGFEVAAVDIVPDDGARIAAWLRARAQAFDLLFTTGGTGLAVRDVTPEATASVLDYEVPGLAELMRQKGVRKTPMAALSRSRAGVRGRALIVNLPGSVKGATESLEAVLPLLEHAVNQLKGIAKHPTRDS
jgi:molybdenum cofactor synthesis domain-containing protein